MVSLRGGEPLLTVRDLPVDLRQRGKLASSAALPLIRVIREAVIR